MRGTLLQCMVFVSRNGMTARGYYRMIRFIPLFLHGASLFTLSQVLLSGRLVVGGLSLVVPR